MEKFYTSGFSVLYVPEGHVYKRTDKIIRKLAHEYQGPEFAPHVTLLGGIDLPEEDFKDRTKKIASRLSPFNISVKGIGYRDEVWRSIFGLVEETPEVVDTYKMFCKGMEMDERKSWWFPHISLFYGNLPEPEKKKIIKNIGPLDFNFKVNKLVLLDSEGAIEDWKVIEEIPLSG